MTKAMVLGQPLQRRRSSVVFQPTLFLADSDVRSRRIAAGAVVFAQGSACDSVFYLDDGAVKLSVLSSTGKEAVVALLGPTDFFGEGCLAGQPLRMGGAVAISAATVLEIPKAKMSALLRANSDFSDAFIAHMLDRNIRVEEDLIDQLFNSTEKRLARTLLLLSRYGTADATPLRVPKLSQETLAEMVGTTRPRINFFMNKFRRLGFIQYDAAGVTVHAALLSIVLRE